MFTRYHPTSWSTLAILFVFCLWTKTTAVAEFYKKDGITEASERSYQSLTILSSDKKASITFYCDEGAIYPRITFKRIGKIKNKGDAFQLRYINDKGVEDQHNFLAIGAGNIGRFFIRHTQLYAARFGEQPVMFEKGSATFSQDYINWDANIRRTVLHDIVDGDVVDITIWDETTQSSNYHFDTKGFTKFLPLIGHCLGDLTN